MYKFYYLFTLNFYDISMNWLRLTIA